MRRTRRFGTATAALAGLVLLLGMHDAPAARAANGGARGLAPLLAASTWLDGRATPTSLAGKVVVVDVFTVGCYNCANVTPNLRKLSHEQGVAVVGVHSPETAYERERPNVVAGLTRLGIDWPVAIDDDFAVWRAYGVDAWPTQLVFDRHGKLRATIVGDSQDAELDRTVDALRAESGTEGT